ncbi:MAG: hypothetical protein GY815_15515, partial [Gammaproteobacteria bacterium]|nr:hypothetical protein [Gammaproteobacteria bacterium]
FTMKTFEAADIVAYFDGVEVVGGYAAAVSADQDVQPGGSVTFDAAPANDVNVNIRREVEADQETDYSQYDAFPEETHENALDKLTMLVQELEETVSRIPQLPVDMKLDGDDRGFPQANMVSMYNVSLDGQESTGSDANTFNTNVTATATCAVAAAASADLGYNWAQQAEDVEGDAGEYSAYHWAQKAEAAGGVVVQVVNEQDGEVATTTNVF